MAEESLIGKSECWQVQLRLQYFQRAIYLTELASPIGLRMLRQLVRQYQFKR